MRASDLPALPEGFEYRLDLRHHVTPRLLRDQPIHRWFWFPHSFSPQLIDEILRAYPIGRDKRILDPFVGAGTTVLRARELGYAAVGSDLSPLSLFVSRVKLVNYDKSMLEECLGTVLGRYRPIRDDGERAERISRAFTADEMAHLNGLRQQIDDLPQPAADFFRLVLLRVQQSLSRARPDGGWFRWVEIEDQSLSIQKRFAQQAHLYIADVASEEWPPAQILHNDARRLDDLQGEYDLVITSPPYPNRHDYSRIFHIELLSLGVTESEIKGFRHGSIRSHVEAKEPPLSANGYTQPSRLIEILDCLPANVDPRVRPLLSGYFEDMYLALRSLRQHLKPGGICAFVVGNVRHAGVMVPVDEILIEVGQNVGYCFVTAWIARLRGNSAQQMGQFGREPARESIVFLRRNRYF
jgi:SAM-dependent methyltransferase